MRLCCVHPEGVVWVSAADLVAAWEDLAAAYPGYMLAERMYDGNVDEVFSTPAARRAIADTGLEYRFNLIALPVDKLADRVELRAVTSQNETATERIAQAWKANDLDVQYPHLIRKSFVYGDAYLMVWPVEDDAGTAADDDLAASGVEFTVHSPKHCRVMYDPEHPRRKAYAMLRWQVRDPDSRQWSWRVDLWYPDRADDPAVVEHWASKPGVGAPSRAEDWVPWLDDDEDPDSWLVPNPYGEIPFFHHRAPDSMPVHRRGYGCQHAINKSLITQITTLDYSGWPERYALMEKGASLDSAHDDPDWTDDADNPGALTSGVSSSARSGPGTMRILDGVREVGTWTGANPDTLLKPAEFYVRLMALLTTTPQHFFDAGGDIPSGESRKVADMPLVAKARHAALCQTSTVEEEWLFALRVMDTDADDLGVRWAPADTATSRDDWAVIGAKQESGVPQRQTLVEAGYESEQVQTWLDQDAEAMDLARRVALLDTMAGAMQKMAAGVATGVLTQEQASVIVRQMVGQVAPAPGSEDAK